MSLNEINEANQINSLELSDNPIKIKGKSGRPRKYPIDPLLGKTNYKVLVHDVRNSTRVTCPNCCLEIMQCNLSHHKKTEKCKKIGEIINLRNMNNPI